MFVIFPSITKTHHKKHLYRKKRRNRFRGLSQIIFKYLINGRSHTINKETVYSILREIYHIRSSDCRLGPIHKKIGFCLANYTMYWQNTYCIRRQYKKRRSHKNKMKNYGQKQFLKSFRRFRIIL